MVQTIGNELCTIIGQLNELDDDCYARASAAICFLQSLNISANSEVRREAQSGSGSCCLRNMVYRRGRSPVWAGTQEMA